MNLVFHTCDVFTNRAFAGNPLAVIPEAAGLNTRQMQAIASEFNLSETVFMLPPADPRHDLRLRIFTPSTELPFAGHPTVGAACMLAHLGRVSVADNTVDVLVEEAVRTLPVSIRRTGEHCYFAQFSAPRGADYFDPAPSIEDIATVLSLDPLRICTDRNPPRIVSCGVPFLCVEVTGLTEMRAIHVNTAHWTDRLGGADAPSIYVFTRETLNDDCHLHVRSFPFNLGIAEDSATGSAATALGGYLGDTASVVSGTLTYRLEQGFEMNRPSLIDIEIDRHDGRTTAIRVGGESVPIMQGTLTFPD